MTTTPRSTAAAVFADRVQADMAIHRLREAGFTKEQVGFLMRRPEDEALPAEAEPIETPGGGAVGGMVTGGLLGGLIALGALLIPGVGPVFSGGIFATIIGGIVAGAAAGGVLGALTGAGIPEEEARLYEREFHAGRPIVTVQAGDRYDEAVSLLRASGGRDLSTGPQTETATPASTGGASVTARPESATTSTPPPHAPADALPTDVEPERAAAYATHPESAAIEDTATTMGATAAPHGTGSLEFGGVRGTGSAGSTTPAERPAGQESLRPAGETPQQGPIAQGPTAEERVGRVADNRGEASRQTSNADNPPATGESMTGPLGHWPVSADDPHTAGKYVEGEETAAAGAGPGGETHVPIVTATDEPLSVHNRRHDRLDAELGNERPPYVDTGEDLQRMGATTRLAPGARLPTWDEAAPEYRARWQAGGTDVRWEDVEPGYRYGHEAAAEPRNRGRSWAEAEPGLRASFADWSAQRGYRAGARDWESLRERAREAWETVQGNGEGMTDRTSRRIE